MATDLNVINQLVRRMTADLDLINILSKPTVFCPSSPTSPKVLEQNNPKVSGIFLLAS